MVHRVEVIVNGPQPHNKTIRVYFDSVNYSEVDLEANIRSILAGSERNNPVIVAQRASDWLQMIVDAGPPGRPGRQTFAEFDPSGEDPAVIADPARPDFFWARAAETIGAGPSRTDIYRPTALVGGTATHIIARPFLVRVTWEPVTLVYNIETESPPSALR